MSRYHGIESYVGHTPLIRLRRLSELTAVWDWGSSEINLSINLISNETIERIPFAVNVWSRGSTPPTIFHTEP